MIAESDVKTPSKPRYASKSAGRTRRQVNNVESSVENDTEDELPPLEYTVYLDTSDAVVSPPYTYPDEQTSNEAESNEAESNPIYTPCPPNTIQRTNPVQYVTRSNEQPYYSYVNAAPAVKPNFKPVPNPIPKPIVTTIPYPIAKPIPKGYTHPIPPSYLRSQPDSTAIECPKPPPACNSPIISLPPPPQNPPIPICNCPLIPAPPPTNSSDDADSSCECADCNGANIKKGIIILNQGFCPKKIAALAKALTNLKKHEDGSEKGDDDEQTDDAAADVKVINGVQQLIIKPAGQCDQYAYTELIDAIKKLTSKIEDSKRCACYEDYADDDGDDKDRLDEEPTDCDCASEPNDSNDECATGHDLVKACKNLSKTIATYKRP